MRRLETRRAALLGIDVQRTVVLVWVLAALLAAVSGILVGPLVTVHPHMGLIFTIKGLAGAVHLSGSPDSPNLRESQGALAWSVAMGYPGLKQSERG